MRVIYPAKIKKGSDGIYLVAFRDFKEAFTDGATLEEALFNASEVLTLTLESRLVDGEAIPRHDTVKPKRGEHLIAPEARVQSAILLKWSRGKKTFAQLARVLNTSWSAAQKLENPKNQPSLRNLEKAAAALGKRLVLNLE